MAERTPVFYPTTFPSPRTGDTSGYVNRAASSFSEFDFTFTFMLSLPAVEGQPDSPERQEIVSQLTMSPQYAKSLAALLQDNVRLWEARFGLITQPSTPSTP